MALLVRDYDEALAFYIGKLGFTLVEDTDQPEQAAAIGNQSSGRVFLFLATDDFARDHAAFTAAGVHFTKSPRHEPYGTVAVFEDLYGNLWDLIEYARPD
ncbi:VOC family protein [Sphingomonas sp. 28-62-11]|uniref:VOC family protein n=1 Tax=Sphingomonas sp. 28-62-11 TaxID=1970432 RepID=UPI000BD6CD37|nr:MAG: hypothetical protein B7Y49_08650 [Sphingomonas sp. 28-62-11]